MDAQGCTSRRAIPEDLAAKVEWVWTHPREMEEMGHMARAEYKAKYTAERNYEMLMEIYTKAIAARGQGVLDEVRDDGIQPAVGRGC